MFIFTYELIKMAASNSLLVFCFCNLIIVFLLVGSLNSSSQVAEDKTIPLPGEVNSIKSSSEGANASCSPGTNGEQKDSSETESLSVNIEVVSDNEESQEEEEEEEEDDELRRRAEEFIEKINRCWREEKLRAYSLEHQ